MFTKQSSIDQHCIIQWHALGKERDQKFFQNCNPSSQSLLPSYLKVSKDIYFSPVEKEDFRNKFHKASYMFDERLFNSRKLPPTTTDLFLYGHSTTRETINGKFTRGISVGKHYVSAMKLARYIDEITPLSLKSRDKMRIWMLSCHSGMICDYTYSEHFSQSLKNIHGWENKNFIGFERVVTSDTLRKCREIASSTKLFDKMNLRSISHEKPRVLAI